MARKKIFFSFFSIFEKTTPRPQIIARNRFLGMYITKSNRLKFLCRGKKRIENFFSPVHVKMAKKRKICISRFSQSLPKTPCPNIFGLKAVLMHVHHQTKPCRTLFRGDKRIGIFFFPPGHVKLCCEERKKS